MRAIIIFIVGLSMSVNLSGQSKKNDRLKTHEAIEKYVSESVTPVIDNEHKLFLETLSAQDAQLLASLKTEKSEMLEKRKMKRGEKRKPFTDIPKDVDRETFHKLMKERKVEQNEMREDFKMDVMYLSHKYEEQIQVHMDNLAVKKETWKEELNSLRPSDKPEKERKTARKMNGERGEKKMNRKRHGDVSSFLLWDNQTQSAMKLTGLRKR